MRVGLFTDTYYPQVSGVATSIRTLKIELEHLGNEVFIFTTTDKNIEGYDDPTIIRLPSIPFMSFSDRRVVYRGLLSAYKIAKAYKLDIIHTQTEFSMGMFGKVIGRALNIPVVHTYHTQYEDYVHYIANGKVIRSGMVKYIVRDYLDNLDGVICPSRIVYNVLDGYSVKIPKVIIPTGINIEEYRSEGITEEDCQNLRYELGISSEETMLLSLSRISYEKNIQAIIRDLPRVLEIDTKFKLIICGDGPYREDLEELAKEVGVSDYVHFTGMIDHDETALYYKASDYFISASTSETQGLTYLESIASGTPIIAHGNPYLNDVITDRMFGVLYYHETDLADAILDAMLRRVPKDELMWNQKLEEISAETFGKTVHSFYLDTIIRQGTDKSKQMIVINKGIEQSFDFAKATVKLPGKVFRGTARTSAKVIHAPKKIVHSIKDFLD